MNTELAWAAGFFDGEGYVDRRSRLTLALDQAVVNDEIVPEVLQRFKRAVSAPNEPVRLTKRAEHHKVTYRLSINGMDAVRALQLMWPYLSAVKKQAALASLEAFIERGKWNKREFLSLAGWACNRGHSIEFVRTYSTGKTSCSKCNNGGYKATEPVRPTVKELFPWAFDD